MKLGSILAWPVPELRKMTGGQLLEVWSACTPYSRGKIYLHIILLLACCSLIFNLAMWLGGSFIVDLFGLLIGLTIPANIYFYKVFTPRRAEVRRFVEENWDEFNK